VEGTTGSGAYVFSVQSNETSLTVMS
jgi:hypothetical protein